MKYKQFRFKNGNTYYMALVACKKCRKERWLTRYQIEKKMVTGICRSCSLKMIHGDGFQRGNKNPMWSGGRLNRRGYILVKMYPEDSFYKEMATKRHGYVLEHRLIMAKYKGRALYPYEIVHHINGNKSDNRIENLQIVSGLQNTAYYFYEKYNKENKI